MTVGAAPPDYVPVIASHAKGLAVRSVAAALQHALEGGRSLHAWAESQPGARAYQGRATAWAVTLGPERVVVRHSTHGGVLAPVTGDLFRSPTRAPAEFEASQRLAALQIPSPTVIAYAVYPAALGFARADVATREVPDGEDLLAALARASVDERRSRVLPAVARLLDAMAVTGVQHPDLNAKNILLASNAQGDCVAWILDVDVVRFEAPNDPESDAANRARLARSLVKRAALFAAPLTTADGALLGLPQDAAS